MKVGKILSFNEINGALSLYRDNLKKYDLSKPVRVTFDLLGWGKSSNLILCFSTEKIRFKTSVFFNEEYHSRDGSICFNDINLCGKKMELMLNRTKNGYINVLSGTIIEE